MRAASPAASCVARPVPRPSRCRVFCSRRLSLRFMSHLSDVTSITSNLGGNRTAVPLPRERHPFRGRPAARSWRSALDLEAVRPDFPLFRPAAPVDSPACTGADLGRGSWIRFRIFRNSSLGTAAAHWNVTYPPWLTALAPIFTCLDRRCRSIPRRGQRPVLGLLWQSRRPYVVGGTARDMRV